MSSCTGARLSLINMGGMGVCGAGVYLGLRELFRAQMCRLYTFWHFCPENSRAVWRGGGGDLWSSGQSLGRREMSPGGKVGKWGRYVEEEVTMEMSSHQS